MENNQYIAELRSFRENCTICNGSGYTLERIGSSVKFVDCSCVRVIEDRLSLLKANLPQRYWDWDFRNLSNKFKEDNGDAYKALQEYHKSIIENINKGNGLWLASNAGLAKSSIVGYFVREALRSSVESYYCRASHLLSSKFDALGSKEQKDFINYIISDVKLLAMEEIDKLYLKSDVDMVNQLFYELLSDIYDSGKALLVTSNLPRTEVIKLYPPFIQDRLSTLQYLPLVGGYSGRAHG